VKSTVRRLGYMLEYFGYLKQAKALMKFAQEAKSFKTLNPSIKTLVPELEAPNQCSATWKLIINTPLEFEQWFLQPSIIRGSRGSPLDHPSDFSKRASIRAHALSACSWLCTLVSGGHHP